MRNDLNLEFKFNLKKSNIIECNLWKSWEMEKVRMVQVGASGMGLLQARSIISASGILN